jgi:hypothetical protein
MNLSNVLDRAWAQHGEAPSAALARVQAAIPAAQIEGDLIAVTRFLTHIYGVHLGEFAHGIQALKALRAHSVWYRESALEVAIVRCAKALEMAYDGEADLTTLSASEKAHVLALASGCVLERGETTNAAQLLHDAREGAESADLPRGDPALRALAIAGNNAATFLEELPLLDAEQQATMIAAAKTGRIFWERAGTWLEIERAEYRLAKSYLKAGDIEAAAKHARACIAMCEENRAPALEFFFGIEALAYALAAQDEALLLVRLQEKSDTLFNALSKEDQQWCAPTHRAVDDLRAVGLRAE